MSAFSDVRATGTWYGFYNFILFYFMYLISFAGVGGGGEEGKDRLFVFKAQTVVETGARGGVLI